MPIAAAGMGVLGAAGLVLGARRLRRLRRLPREPESEVVVEGGFAEAEPAHDLTRGLHGAGFDPLAALVGRFQQFIAEHSLASVQVVAACHGRSSTTLTLHCSLAEQPILLDLAATFAEQLEAEVEGCISADQDVVLRLVRLRKTRLLPSADAPQDAPCLVPLGVLYDRQVYSVAWPSLGHILVVSLPGHGSDTILTSLVATLTARRSPGQLRIWMIASARALPVPVFELPHLVRVVDAADPSAIGRAAEDLRAELDWRADHPAGDLLVVVPELKTLGEHAARFALLAARALELGAHFVVASSDPEEAAANPLTAQFDTRMVLRMQTEEASVALLGVADAAFLGGGGRLLLRLDGREPVELYGYQVAAEHLERLVKVMRTAYPAPVAAPAMGASQRAQAAAPPAAPQTTEHPPHLQPGASPAPTSQEPPPPSPRMNATSPVEPEVEEPCQPIIQLFCFGRPRVVCAGQQVWPRGGGDAKPWEFLLYLGCQPVDGVARSSVVEALWPEDELPDEGAHRFRQLRYRLRRQLQEVPGAPDGDGVCLGRRSLRLDPCLVYSDAQEFLTLVRSVRVNPGPDAVERLERARALYVGDLLEGPDTRRYAWVDERDGSGVTLREHFRRLFQNASVRLAELYTAAGALEPAIELYRELTDLDPADDRLWLALLRLHAQRGDRPALIAEERRLRETLRELAEEVDSASTPGADEPSREIVEEYQRLLAQLRDREPAAV